MKTKAYFLSLFLAVLILSYASPAFCQEEKAIRVDYFFENYCETCKDKEEFFALLPSLTGTEARNIEYHAYNIIYTEGKEALKQALKERNLSESDVLLPVVFVGDRVYSGSKAIMHDMPEYTMAHAGDSVSSFYYLYLTGCEGCQKVSPLLEQLPDEMEVRRGDYHFLSQVDMRDVNINQDPQLAQALFDGYKVPESKRLAPIILAGSGYYQGELAIRNFIRYGLADGCALDSILLDLMPSGTQNAAVLNRSAFLSGLVGGLNPCALSMLLLVISVLVSAGKDAKVYVSVFLLVKFAAYLCLGYVFYSVFLLWNPAWLTAAARIILSVMAAGLIVINLSDAWQAFHASFGKIKNQLPGKIRKQLEGATRKLILDGHAPLLLCVIVLGILISCGEFLCSGQIYLATLLHLIHTEAASAGAYLSLLGYCAGFIIPSAVLSCAALYLKSTLKASRFLADKMGWIKILNAVFFAVLIVLEWM